GDLDPPAEVAGAPVGRANEVFRLTRVAELEDARVLQEATQDAAHGDVLREAGHARTQAADATDDQLAPHASGRGTVERRDHLRVREPVDLHPYVAALPGASMFRLARDELQEALAHVERGDEQVLELGRCRVAGEAVEHLLQLLTQAVIDGEQPEVRVGRGGGGVQVSRADIQVAAQAALLAADDQQHLRMHLEVRGPVHYMDSGGLQLSRPLDVALLIEA